MKQAMLALAFVPVLGACAYQPEPLTDAMSPVRLADGSVQQTTVAIIYDKACVGPTTVQMITYHAPAGSNMLRPVASGTVSGDGQCVALIKAGGQIIGYSLIDGVDNSVNSVTVSEAVATSSSSS